MDGQKIEVSRLANARHVPYVCHGKPWQLQIGQGVDMALKF